MPISPIRTSKRPNGGYPATDCLRVDSEPAKVRPDWLESPYDKNILAYFPNSILFLDPDQAYPFRMYIAFINGEKRRGFSALTELEFFEFRERVVPLVRRIIRECELDPHSIDEACYGQVWDHLHIHMVPRYEETPMIAGYRFVDPNPGGNWGKYEKGTVPESVSKEILSMAQQAARTLVQDLDYVAV